MTIVVTEPLREVAALYLRETTWALTPDQMTPRETLERIMRQRAACEQLLAYRES
jgi:hypothetical protein